MESEGSAGTHAPRQQSSAEEAPAKHASESAGVTNAARLAHLEKSSANQAPRRLLTDRQAAAMLGVGDRTFADMVASAEWLCTPIVLGPRLRRWDPDELMYAVRTRAPRGGRSSEPAQLRRARIERMKSYGVPEPAPGYATQPGDAKTTALTTPARNKVVAKCGSSPTSSRIAKEQA